MLCPLSAWWGRAGPGRGALFRAGGGNGRCEVTAPRPFLPRPPCGGAGSALPARPLLPRGCRRRGAVAPCAERSGAGPRARGVGRGIAARRRSRAAARGGQGPAPPPRLPRGCPAAFPRGPPPAAGPGRAWPPRTSPPRPPSAAAGEHGAGPAPRKASAGRPRSRAATGGSPSPSPSPSRRRTRGGGQRRRRWKPRRPRRTRGRGAGRRGTAGTRTRPRPPACGTQVRRPASGRAAPGPCSPPPAAARPAGPGRAGREGGRERAVAAGRGAGNGQLPSGGPVRRGWLLGALRGPAGSPCALWFCAFSGCLFSIVQPLLGPPLGFAFHAVRVAEARRGSTWRGFAGAEDSKRLWGARVARV